MARTIPAFVVSFLWMLLLLLATTSTRNVAAINAPVTTTNDPNLYFDGTTSSEAYRNWLSTNGNKYERSTFLPSPTSSEDGVALHWTMELQKDTDGNFFDDASIRLAVAARADGWVGFGFAESGGMKGADIVYYMKENNQLVDSYVLDDWKVGPIEDDSCQNWRLIDSFVEDGFIIFEATRLLDTKDNQDRQLIYDDSHPESKPTPVIVAWGDTPTISYHGPNARTKAMVRFFLKSDNVAYVENLFHTTMTAEAEGYFDMKSDYPIVAKDTIYRSFCTTASQMMDQGVPLDKSLHIIGVEPMMKPETVQYLHHITVFGRTFDTNETAKCRTEHTRDELMYAWSIGEPPMAVVPEAGFPLGGYLPGEQGGELGHSVDDWGFISFRLEIHYNNPGLDDYNGTMIDKSGFRFYYTSQKREYDMGMFTTGDYIMALNDTQIGDGVSEHTFTCPSSCTDNMLPPEGITIVEDNLHMHATGTVMTNQIIRNGKIVQDSKVEYFDFDQAGVFKVPQNHYKILPGDSIRTTCHFNTEYRIDPESNESVIWGYRGRDEMCIDFVFYYPRIAKDIDDIPGLNTLKGMLGERFAFKCNYLFDFPFPCLARHTIKQDLEETNIVNERQFGISSTSQYVETDSATGRSSSSSSSSSTVEDVERQVDDSTCHLPPETFSSAATTTTATTMAFVAMFSVLSVVTLGL